MYVCMYVEYIYIYIYIIYIIIILRNNNEKHDPNMQTTKKKLNNYGCQNVLLHILLNNQ